MAEAGIKEDIDQLTWRYENAVLTDEEKDELADRINALAGSNDWERVTVPDTVARLVPHFKTILRMNRFEEARYTQVLVQSMKGEIPANLSEPAEVMLFIDALRRNPNNLPSKYLVKSAIKPVISDDSSDEYNARLQLLSVAEAEELTDAQIMAFPSREELIRWRDEFRVSYARRQQAFEESTRRLAAEEQAEKGLSEADILPGEGESLGVEHEPRKMAKKTVKKVHKDW
jgi:hypothetical protein